MLLLTLLVLPLLSATSAQHRRFDHDRTHDAKRLPSAWYHHPDHPVHSLFRRSSDTDGATYAPVGSDDWAKGYPPDAHPDVKTMPAEWLAALNDAIARKAIPDIPLSKNTTEDGDPVYPTGSDPTGPEICSATYGCRIDGDVWDAPAGYVGLSFDDGPEAGTDDLVAFLEKNKQPVTHFMIGGNIRDMPDKFIKVFNLGDDIAVHTWTHPHMTTQSNELVVAELGWTMQIIHNSTGGRVPKFWRPPYGDTDKRVSAIAKEVFGLTTIIWNQDTEDWSLTDSPPGTTAAKISSSMHDWLTGSKNPGLIILEHELSPQSVASFVAAYPLMHQNNWNVVSLAQLIGHNASYQNAANSTSPVNAVNVINAKSGSPPSASASSAAGASLSVTKSQSPASQSGTSSSPSSTPSTKPNSAAPRWATRQAMLISAAVFLVL